MLTPQESYPKLAKKIGIPKIILKREDLHPYGSHKGRSIPYMIAAHTKQGYSDFVISSSGNAALAAAYAVNEYNKKNNNPEVPLGIPTLRRDKKITLQIFVGKHIEAEKLRKLKNFVTEKNITITQTNRPKQSAFLLEKITPHHKGAGLKNLRQSTDDLALSGYQSLAEELSEITNLQAVFMPTSSGTTAEALGKFLSPKAQIHIVQTSAHHPIAEGFDENFIEEENSLATAMVDMVAHRKKKVVEVIKKSGGFGWIVMKKEINEAIKTVKKTTGIDISPNSALSVAGIIKAVRNNQKFTGAVVCLITGK